MRARLGGRSAFAAAFAAGVLLLVTPLSASAASTTYWDGMLGAYDTKTSATTQLNGARTGPGAGVNVTIWAQTITPFGIYASSEGNMAAAEVTHGTITGQARCFQRPYGGANPSNIWLICRYLS
ncbi:MULTISPECIES: hypothetical protein [Bacteria]|uniref:hypothetical protein n=1 Tax=Bacteria TaxID=2 RepID=UPI0018CEE40B|nr:hypothetical protein [Bacillus toyonensis]